MIYILHFYNKIDFIWTCWITFNLSIGIPTNTPERRKFFTLFYLSVSLLDALFSSWYTFQGWVKMIKC